MPLEAMRTCKAKRWNQRLVSEESAFYTQIGVGCPDADVNEESCDVLWSTTVECNQFVGDVHWSCAASVVKSNGLLAYDGSMEIEHGSLLTEG